MILKNGWLWYLNFTIFFSFSGYVLPEAKSKNIYHIDTVEDLLDHLDSKEPEIIKTYSKNCPFCTMIGPKFDKLAQHQKYMNRIKFSQLDGKQLEAHKHIAAKSQNKYKIPGYPTFIFINKGEIQNIFIGGDEKKLIEKIEQFSKNL